MRVSPADSAGLGWAALWQQRGLLLPGEPPSAGGGFGGPGGGVP